VVLGEISGEKERKKEEKDGGPTRPSPRSAGLSVVEKKGGKKGGKKRERGRRRTSLNFSRNSISRRKKKRGGERGGRE